MTVSDILNYSKFKNSNPIGLKNILIALNNRAEYVTASNLKDDKFYEKFQETINHCKTDRNEKSYNGQLPHGYRYGELREPCPQERRADLVRRLFRST